MRVPVAGFRRFTSFPTSGLVSTPSLRTAAGGASPWRCSAAQRGSASLLTALLVLALLAVMPRALHAQTVTATVNVGSEPRAAAVNSVTNQVYLAGFNSNYVTVVDGATNNTTTVSVGHFPAAVAVNPVTNRT